MINVDINMEEDDFDRGLCLLERCLDFSNLCYEQMGAEGVFIQKEDFLEFFPHPEEDFGSLEE